MQEKIFIVEFRLQHRAKLPQSTLTFIKIVNFFDFSRFFSYNQLIHVKAASSGIPINYQYLKENKPSNFEYSTSKTHQIAFQNTNTKSFWIPRIHFNLIRYAAKDGNVTIFCSSVCNK